MFSQGVSHRTDPMRQDRVFHILVRDDSASTGWRTLVRVRPGPRRHPGPLPRNDEISALRQVQGACP